MVTQTDDLRERNCGWNQIVIRSDGTSGPTIMICDMADSVHHHYITHSFSEISLIFCGILGSASGGYEHYYILGYNAV
jgi:hypothetical protein